MTSSAHGYFVWHDLITTDIPAAIQFYKKVVGWSTQAFDPEGQYMMWANNSGPVGGIGPADDVAPHWRPYIGTDDIDATIELAEKLGGEVLIPPTDISNGGKWAVLKDPQGNEFGVYWSTNNPRPEMTMQPGEFHWHELATDDYKHVFDFYQQLFGWEPAREHDIGEVGTYALFKNEGRPHGMGGMFNKPMSMPQGGWRTYTIVKDVGKAVAAIKKSGGKITQPPVEVPGGSWTLKFIDAQGVPHALTSTENASAKAANSTTESPQQTSSARPKAKVAASETASPAKKSARKSTKKKTVKKVAAKKVVRKKPRIEEKELEKAEKKSEKKKKKQLKKQKKLEKKFRKKAEKDKKKAKAKRKK